MTVTPDFLDPDVLVELARDYLASEEFDSGPVARSAAEEHFKRAYARLAHDLDALREAPVDGAAVAERFGTLLHDKIACLILLARGTLRDLADPAPHLDVEFARRDMTLYVNLLTQLGAADGLGVLYDFAVSQRHAAKPGFWPDVARYLLTQLAGAPGGDGAVPRCLAQRPDARERLGAIAQAAEPAQAMHLRELLRAAEHCALSDAAPAYLRIYHRFDDDAFPVKGAASCANVAAQHRVQLAFNAGDLPALLRWFAQGSPAAVQEIFRMAEVSLPAKRQTRLFTECLELPDLDPVRQTAAVLQLGTLNLAMRPDGGQADINRALVECAFTHDPEREGVARAAVRELVPVSNQDALLYLMINAPLIAVAEEGVAALCVMRRLRVVEPLLNIRPELRPAYRAAHQHLLEIQHTVEAVWSATSPDLVHLYLERLKALHAYPELERLNELRQGGNAVFL